jgi:hypothetical protein
VLRKRADTPFCSQVKSAFVVQFLGGDDKGEVGEFDLSVAHVRCERSGSEGK